MRPSRSLIARIFPAVSIPSKVRFDPLLGDVEDDGPVLAVLLANGFRHPGCFHPVLPKHPEHAPHVYGLEVSCVAYQDNASLGLLSGGDESARPPALHRGAFIHDPDLPVVSVSGVWQEAWRVLLRISAFFVGSSSASFR